MLQTKDLTKKYFTKTVLNGIDIQLEEGKIYGLLGPNASGKTTFMKIAAGLAQPTSGEISVSGNKIGVSTKQIVSYMPTTNHLPLWMKVSQCLNWFQGAFSNFQSEQAKALLNEMGIKEEEKIGSFSSGMLGRFKLLLTISRNAKLYLLDEPLNGLDPVSREKIVQAILSTAGEHNTFLISSHLINELENVFEEIIFLDQGKVVLSGNAEEFRVKKGISIDGLYREVYRNA
ncbi:MAG: ABC transporter ATP-binding protein [Desulfitobacteriaceae bacterium]|nr:ABC transporter ATP-binding protein [Desulfitobacteriaceae bacterium]MDD4752584.1 ABC transporter ATP-binding protein [Desulfitobacteriaceae bacterium]